MLVLELAKTGGEGEDGREPITTFLFFLYLILSFLLLSLETAHIFRSSLSFRHWISFSRPTVLVQMPFQQAFIWITFHITRWLDEQENSTVQNHEGTQRPVTSQREEESKNLNDKESESQACQDKFMQPYAKEAELNSSRDVKQRETYKAMQFFQEKTHECCLERLQGRIDNKQQQDQEDYNQQTHKPHLDFESYIKESKPHYKKWPGSQDTQNPLSAHTRCSQNYVVTQYNSSQSER